MEHVVEHQVLPRGGAFHITEEGRRIAEMTYLRVSASVVVINHTEVTPELRGQGVAKVLLDAAVRWARASHTGLRSTCSYVTAQFARDASLRDVIA